MNKIYFGPWNEVQTEYRRTDITNRYFARVSYIHYYKSYECYCKLFSIYEQSFRTALDAKNTIDELLVNKGCILLSQEQYDKLIILL
jgi:hypothetical protein